MKPWTVAVILVALVAVMLVASLTIHPAPTKCFTDSNMANDPSLPCYEPPA
jgi:hypothetical protein